MNAWLEVGRRLAAGMQSWLSTLDGIVLEGRTEGGR
jgi:hypothetical protein